LRANLQKPTGSAAIRRGLTARRAASPTDNSFILVRPKADFGFNFLDAKRLPNRIVPQHNCLYDKDLTPKPGSAPHN
jgi:hypothetical protein